MTCCLLLEIGGYIIEEWDGAFCYFCCCDSSTTTFLGQFCGKFVKKKPADIAHLDILQNSTSAIIRSNSNLSITDAHNIVKLSYLFSSQTICGRVTSLAAELSGVGSVGTLALIASGYGYLLPYHLLSYLLFAGFGFCSVASLCMNCNTMAEHAKIRNNMRAEFSSTTHCGYITSIIYTNERLSRKGMELPPPNAQPLLPLARDDVAHPDQILAFGIPVN